MPTRGPGGADWDDVYLGDGADTEPLDRDLLADALALPPGRALDLGCGAGGNVIGLARRGWRATGIDSSGKAIDSARISARSARVEARFLAADLFTWRPDGPYDLVVSLFSLPPRGERRDALLGLARRVLAPGGTLIVGEWETVDPDCGPYVTVGELTGSLADLEIIRSGLVNADPDRGPEKEPSRQWPAVVVTSRKSL